MNISTSNDQKFYDIYKKNFQHIITKNHRMTVSHVENRAWVLRIKDVKESDKGWYMCQINTDPMKNQVGYLNVVGEFQLEIPISNRFQFILFHYNRAPFSHSAPRHPRLSNKHGHGS